MGKNLYTQGLVTEGNIFPTLLGIAICCKLIGTQDKYKTPISSHTYVHSCSHEAYLRQILCFRKKSRKSLFSSSIDGNSELEKGVWYYATLIEATRLYKHTRDPRDTTYICKETCFCKLLSTSFIISYCSYFSGYFTTLTVIALLFFVAFSLV